MNFGRCAHAACILEDKFYVFAGRDKWDCGMKYVESMEVLDLKDPREWTILQEGNSQLARRSALVTPINSHQILMMGGMVQEMDSSDCFVYDTVKGTLT